MQYLILPLDNCQITAGYKNSTYQKRFGFTHYGVDLSFKGNSSRVLKAMGEGRVKLAGYDNIFGNTVVTVYPEVVVSSGYVRDITVRLYHMESIDVTAGAKVKRGDMLGVMGNTGKYTTGTHVHVEIDSDTEYYNYGPGLAGDSNLIKAGVDTTLDPFAVLVLGDGQSCIDGAGEYNNGSMFRREGKMEGRYIVRKWWSEPGSELGRYADGYTAVGECPEGYRIFDEEGTTLFPFEENSYRGLYEQVKKELEELRESEEGELVEELKKAKDQLADYEGRMVKIREILGE